MRPTCTYVCPGSVRRGGASSTDSVLGDTSGSARTSSSTDQTTSGGAAISVSRVMVPMTAVSPLEATANHHVVQATHSASWALSSFLRILPVPPLGRSDMKRTDRGYLYAASRSFVYAMTSSSVSSMPSRTQMTACTSSPSRSSEMPMTAHSAMAGCAYSTSSISRG